MIATGRRDKRVQLHHPGPLVADGEGGYTEDWQPLDPPEMLAHIDAATARDLERAVSGTVLSTATHLIGMLYHPGITIQTRVTYGTREFQVTAVRNPDEANRELLLVAEEILS
jgi:head-tail adaptor